MSKGNQNEKKFGNWKQTLQGGRLYWLDVPGRSGWRARYWKEVDSTEATVRFWQEIFNEEGKLVEMHEKFPVDKGHQKV